MYKTKIENFSKFTKRVQKIAHLKAKNRFANYSINIEHNNDNGCAVFPFKENDLYYIKNPTLAKNPVGFQRIRITDDAFQGEVFFYVNKIGHWSRPMVLFFPKNECLFDFEKRVDFLQQSSFYFQRFFNIHDMGNCFSLVCCFVHDSLDDEAKDFCDAFVGVNEYDIPPSRAPHEVFLHSRSLNYFDIDKRTMIAHFCQKRKNHTSPFIISVFPLEKLIYSKE